MLGVSLGVSAISGGMGNGVDFLGIRRKRGVEAAMAFPNAAGAYYNATDTSSITQANGVVTAWADSWGGVDLLPIFGTGLPAYDAGAKRMGQNANLNGMLGSTQPTIGNTNLFCGPDDEWFVCVPFRQAGAGTLFNRAADGASNNTFNLFSTGSGVIRVQARGLQTNLKQVNPGETHVIQIWWDGTKLQYAMDNDAAVAIPVGSTPLLARPFMFMGQASGTFFWPGESGSLFVSDKAMDDEHRRSVASELAAQQGVFMPDPLARPVNLTSRPTYFVPIGGQSNAVGTDADDGGAPYPPRTYQVARGGAAIDRLVVNAVDPLYNQDAAPNTMGMARGFATKFHAAYPNSNLVFIPCATPASSFEEGAWGVGNPLSLDMISRISGFATQYPSAQCLCIIWHQGEGDFENAQYSAQLQAHIPNIRSANGLSSTTPFLLGELAPFLRSFNSAFEAPNNVILAIPGQIPYTAVTPSAGTTGRDSVHFDSASLRLMGERYFDQIAIAQANTP